MSSRYSNEKGASIVEYALLIALISLVSITAFVQTGVAINNQFSKATQQMDGNGPMGDGIQGEGEGS